MFRPSSGVIVTVVIWVIAAVILGTLVLVGDGPGSELWPMVPAIGAVAWLTWVVLWWPCVRLAGEGVDVRNPFRTIRIPWSDIVDVDSRGTLVLTTPAGRVKAWAAPPAVSSFQRRADAVARARARIMPRPAPKKDVEPDVAETIRRIQTGRYRLPTTGETYATVTVSWNVVVIVVSVVAVAAAIVGLL